MTKRRRNASICGAAGGQFGRRNGTVTPPEGSGCYHAGESEDRAACGLSSQKLKSVRRETLKTTKQDTARQAPPPLPFESKAFHSRACIVQAAEGFLQVSDGTAAAYSSKNTMQQMCIGGGFSHMSTAPSTQYGLSTFEDV